MSSFSKATLLGAEGMIIGYHLIRAFLADGAHQVTVLARSGSKTSYPPAVKLVKISDFGDHEELVQALKGQDVLISCANLSLPFETSQRQIVAELERQQGVKYDVLPFKADEEGAAAKHSWTGEDGTNSICVTIPAVILLPEYETAFKTAAKFPIAEWSEGMRLPPLGAGEVVEEWIRDIDSVEA
ncbi:hypothetical protein KC333_g8215 [Hortaea werneckii]|nr:hypothetical protein KC333_g8215 [Hortaea werneckii]KAI7305210.1 hypothetical protein KC326_g8232 [Hortaea werneckii]